MTNLIILPPYLVECVWNVMAHAQKPHFFFRRKGSVNLNRRWLQFSRLLAAELCASAVVMLDTLCSEVVWRVLATHTINQFPLHFLSRASPYAMTFKLDSTKTMYFSSIHTTSPAHLTFSYFIIVIVSGKTWNLWSTSLCNVPSSPLSTYPCCVYLTFWRRNYFFKFSTPCI